MPAMSNRRATAERAAQRAAQAAERVAGGREAPHLRRFRDWRRRLLSRLAAWLVPWLVRALAGTWRVSWCGAGLPLLHATAPAVLAVWHGRMLAAMPLTHHRGRGMTVLVSPSGDGDLVLGALSHFGYRVVRGSTSRRGARALRDLGTALAAGQKVVLTPDGPRGPMHSMNVGSAWLARAAGVPILPVGIAVDRAWQLRSWDRFTIPKPFARLLVCHGEPLAVPVDASDQELEAVAATLREALLAAEAAAAAALASPRDLHEPQRQGPPREPPVT